jgi:hypoxanthine phosphoribosyltransferase
MSVSPRQATRDEPAGGADPMSTDARERILFSENEIATRVREVARDIAKGPLRPEIAVPILMGAFVFAADILRALAHEGLDLETEFMWLRSYGGSEQPGDVTVLKAPSEIVRGRTVLLLDGVLDRGLTLARARELLDEAGAAAVVSAVVVAKAYPSPRSRADHVLFHAGEEFLYGYGMDRKGLGRGLQDIRVRPKA